MKIMKTSIKKQIFVLLAMFFFVINCQQQIESIEPDKLQSTKKEQLMSQIKNSNDHQNKLPDPQTRPQQQFAKQLQIQTQKQEQLLQQQNQQLPQFIKQQIQQFSTILQLPVVQTFNFLIQPGKQQLFRWNPSKQKQLKLVIDILSVGKTGQLAAITNADQSQFLEVLSRNPNKDKFTQIGKVYRTKVFAVDFNTDYKYIKFINKNSDLVLVQVGIEQLQYVVEKGVPDDLLTLSRNKMHTIILQAQSTQIHRQHLYKWQWGFFQNQKQHQLEILGFTGVQLMAILITSVVQMYLLKGLLDNRSVV